MEGLAMRVVRSSVSLPLLSWGSSMLFRIKRMPSIYFPRLAIAIIALLLFLPSVPTSKTANIK
jgi:hypothetical protein